MPNRQLLPFCICRRNFCTNIYLFITSTDWHGLADRRGLHPQSCPSTYPRQAYRDTSDNGCRDMLASDREVYSLPDRVWRGCMLSEGWAESLTRPCPQMTGDSQKQDMYIPATRYLLVAAIGGSCGPMDKTADTPCHDSLVRRKKPDTPSRRKYVC